MTKPTKNEYAPYYQKYIDTIPEGEICNILEAQLYSISKFLSSIDEEKSLFRYSDGKWSIKEVLGHVIDTERIFGYRALRISRGDQLPLASFDENEYIKNSDYDKIPFKHIVEEFSLVRKSNLILFCNMIDDKWIRKGNAGGYDVTVRAIVHIIAGHAEHHIRIINERYL